MKSTLLIASLLVLLSSTSALAQQESTRSTTRRSTATAKKQAGTTKSKSTKSSKKSAKASKTTEQSAPVAAAATETVTSTPRRQAPATASEPVGMQTQSQTVMIVESEPVESWYGYYGVGYAKPSYPGALQTMADQMGGATGVTNASIAMDAAGVYSPYGGTKILVGAVVNLALDTYIEGEASVTMTQATVASSALYFVDRIGNGVFLRGDVGVAAVSISNELGERLESPVGLGMLAGAGYATGLSNGTDLLLNVNYSARMIDGEAFGAFGVTVGVLF